MTSENSISSKKNINWLTLNWQWIALFLILLLTALIRIPLLDVPLERDEGEYAYGAQLILQGFPPYSAFYNQKLPGIFGAYAIILSVFGETARGIHIGLLFVNAATIILIFFLTRKLTDSKTALFSCATFAILSLGKAVLGIFANAEHFVILPAICGAFFLLKAQEDNKLKYYLLSGLLFGLGFLMKQHGVFFIAFGIACICYEITSKSENLLRYIYKLLCFTLGAGIPLFVTCVVLFRIGVFDKFWFWTVTYASNYASSVSIQKGITYFMSGMERNLATAWPLWLFAVIGLICTYFKNKTRHQPNRPFLLFLLIFSFLAICPGLYFREHYFILLLPVISIYAGIGALFITEWFINIRPIILKKAILGTWFILPFSYPLLTQQYFLFFLKPNMVVRTTYKFNPFEESVIIADYIKKNSSPEDTIAIFGSEPQIYFYSKRRAASGYILTYPLVEDSPYTMEMQKEMINEVASNNPKFLIFVNITTSWGRKRGSPDLILKWITKYTKNSFDVVGVADILNTRKTVFKWGEEAKFYKPRSKSWVSILKKK